MLKKIVSISALALALAACETTDDHAGMADGMYDGSMARGFGDSAHDRVHFALNSSHLTAEGKSTLANQAAWMKEHPCKATVAGNCDERGTAAYNMGLGERRATAAKKELVAHGVPAADLNTISYGKERPVAEGSNEAAWAQNRNAMTTVE